MEFQYVIDPTADEPIMLILNHIGWDENAGQGVDGTEFLKELLLLDTMGKSRIQIWINSIGGSVIDGWSILGGMLKTKTKVDTYNIGVAASTAGWLFQAGRTRYMCDYALWMGHNPSGGTGNNEILDRMRNGIIKTISQRTGLSEDETGTMLDNETYMDAEECKAANFCDEIQKTSSLNIKRVSQAASITDKLNEITLIANTLLPTIPKTTKTIIMADTLIDLNITNALKIDKAASPIMAVEAIEAIQNKLIVSEGSLQVATNKITLTEQERDAMKAKCLMLENEVAGYKSMMEEAEAENRMTEAKNMVTGFATLGKIKNDEATIATYAGYATIGTNAAERLASFEQVKNLLTQLPVNKEAKKIEVITNTATVPVNAAVIMARIHAEKNKK